MDEANEDVLRHLELLLEDSPADSLKRSLGELFKAYTLSLTNDTIPFNLQQTIEDYYNLIGFLDKLKTTQH